MAMLMAVAAIKLGAFDFIEKSFPDEHPHRSARFLPWWPSAEPLMTARESSPLWRKVTTFLVPSARLLTIRKACEAFHCIEGPHLVRLRHSCVRIATQAGVERS